MKTTATAPPTLESPLAAAQLEPRLGTSRIAVRAQRGLSPGVRRLTLGLTLTLVAVLYLWDLSASGYANSFYSAAAQAGSQSWQAFFFGSLDAGNSITVDKPPAALWLMGLSVRIFGLSSWSILAPQALLGVASAALLYAAIRQTLTGVGAADGQLPGVPAGSPLPASRWAISPARAHWAGLAGALAMALTPAATLMFRFNNPDALLVFCYVAASYATIRATKVASRRWLALAGVLIGLGFLAKMLQAFVILPSLVLAYAIAAPASWRRKLLDLSVAAVALVASFGWYLAVVELTPAALRPYIGGSQNNSILELTLGYNGLGRLSGNETGSVGGGGGAAGGGMWGTTGIGRMFTTVSGEMVSWLIPAALVLAVVALILVGRSGFAGLWRSRKAGTTAGLRPASTGADPATVSPIEASSVEASRVEASRVEASRVEAGPTGAQLAAGLLLFGSWLVINGLVFSFMAGIYHDYYTVALAPAIGGCLAIGGAILTSRFDRRLARIGSAVALALTAAWGVALSSVAGGIYLAISIGAAVLLAVAAAVILVGTARLRTGAVIVALIAGLAGPAAYSIQTAATPHTGSIVTAGPARTGLIATTGGPGAGGPGGFRADGNTLRNPGFQPPAGQPGVGPGGFGQGGMGQGGFGQGGRGGGLLNGAQVSSELQQALNDSPDSYTWAAATIGSQNAASYQLATGKAVMAIGGFNGSDPSPTLDQFTSLVAAGKIHYFIAGGGMGRANGGSSAASEITSWVQANFTAKTVGSTTVYDLSAAA